MCKNFEESFREFITKRLNEDMGVLVLDNKKFIEVNEEINQYYKKMLIAFTENDNEAFQESLDKYTSLQGCANGMIEEAAYIQGMRDLYKLLKMLEEGEAD